MNNTIAPQAVPVWYKSSCKNQTVLFRKTFEIPAGIKNAVLYIGSDTDFIVYIDGIEAGRGQFPDYPGTKTFNTITIPSPAAGTHTVAVMAWHSGETFFTGIATFASLTAWIECDGKTVCATGTDWKAAEHSGWRNGYLVKRTVQLTYSTIFEAGKFPADWMAPGFDDSAWSNAAEAEGSFSTFRLRPIPPCELGLPKRGNICACGTVDPAEISGEDNTAACRMSRAKRYFTTELPADSGSDKGIFAIYDLGEESVGFIFFELDAPAGTRVDYGHGEHLDDLWVRTEIGPRRFADEYICREGRNRHELVFHRVGARYIELHITTPEPGQKVNIISCGIRPWVYPLPEISSFSSNDTMSMTLRDVSAKTLHLCMHEHFEDCPWREQAMYAYDSRNQSLYGYYLWGNHDFVRSSYQLTADSFPRRNDNMLSICAPTDCEFTIPMFSLAWMTAAWENYLYSGSRALFDNNREMCKKMMEATLDTFDAATGLYKVTIAPNCWNFYEWSPGLGGTIGGENNGDSEFHILYNAYMLECFRSYAALLEDSPEAAEWQKRSEDLAQAIVTNFYDAENGYFKETFDAVQPVSSLHEHSQFLALALGLAAGDKVEKIFAHIKDGKMHYATLSCMPYLINSMAEHSPETREYMAEKIRSTYSAMIRQGATSMWETQSGADDFDLAGSLCHGWSSLPVYYQGKMLLGTVPLQPGFKVFLVKPYADKYTKCVSGTIPTPAGDIKISWQCRGNGIALAVDAPEELTCEIASYPECPVISAVVNGKKVI